ncbi:hypothetical protein [Ktedonospora formicarum]|uniref:Uncharacterized protein n=1 Tax=Ktedonospora formicarum TaxID=2778364 RepID=A0A8J3ICC6_9CHLR|nr:hypothetical protein [Ktedonospora formicarum]GHO48789.1 hypothetical protein KSX_69520 [Ktedonospora formicarum]
MSVLRFLAPFVCTLFGLYCIIWSLLFSSSPTSMRDGAAFIGLLLLGLAYAHLRLALSYKHRTTTPSEQIG